MNYAIVGFGAVGQALARTFARKGIEVTVATTRAPQEIAAQAEATGPKVLPGSLQDALQADVILLAVPYWSHRDVSKAVADWQGKIIIDVTNAYGVPLSDLAGEPSTAVVARAFQGGAVVKAFNHLPAAVIAQDPEKQGGQRVIFVSSDNEQAAETVSQIVKELGFAPVNLGKLAEGGSLVQARDREWAPLIFQDFIKAE